LTFVDPVVILFPYTIGEPRKYLIIREQNGYFTSAILFISLHSLVVHHSSFSHTPKICELKTEAQGLDDFSTVVSERGVGSIRCGLIAFAVIIFLDGEEESEGNAG
jgi:hypothetical protein